MNKHIYTVGALALALAMSGLPVIALAESNSGEGQDDATVRAAAQTQNVDEQSGRGEEMSESRSGQEIDLELEDDQDQATSLDDLKQKIENRRHELDDEEASTTPRDRDIVKNANPVRLAVHSLLSSKNLLGGIGEQVSEIAKHMNDSVATTTHAEAKIHSRGFLTKFLFGGDSTSADIIMQEAAQNQARIDSLTALLAQANVPADVQATLQVQLTALKDAQARLQALAEKEKSAWGLFSWRF